MNTDALMRLVASLNQRYPKLKKMEMDLVADIAYFKEAHPLRRLVAIPDMLFATWNYNRQAKRYCADVERATTAMKAINQKLAEHLDNKMNEDFSEYL